MTTLVPLTLQFNAAPPFQNIFTLDGNSYLGTVTWNIYGQRWYFTIYDTSGNVIWNGALTASPDNYNIYLAPAIFTTSTILYRDSTGNFEVNP